MSELISSFPHLAELPPTLDDTVHGTPERRPGSLRRTSTIDMTWPGGIGTPLHLVGRSRDLLTPVEGEPRTLGEASMRAQMEQLRTVASIEVSPQREGIQSLVGAVGGSELRAAIDRAVPRERESASPLHVLLDDIAGTSLIAGYAWSRTPEARKMLSGGGPKRGPTGESFGMRKGKIICSGLRPGAPPYTFSS